MSNLETRPREEVCAAGSHATPSGVDGVPGDRTPVEILDHRQVPLGGTRAMDVRRTLPQRARSLVGAWCFLDHYGPDDVSTSDGMQVPPHPHTGLQTVSWLFEGEILHRDSVGSLQTVRPGELNLMTAGRGISHSEESPAGVRPPLLHGVQLWVALPGDRLGDEPFFEHHGDLPVWAGPGGERVQVLVGSLSVGGAALRSAATAFTPLVGAQVDLPAGASVELAVDPGFEHALLVDTGAASFEGVPVPVASLGYVEPGRSVLTVSAGASPVRAVLIGGEPFAEEIVMWWNFVGRSHDDVAAARADWMAQVEVSAAAQEDEAAAAPVPVPGDGGTRYAPGASGCRFGEVVGYDGGPLPAPVLPDVRLKPRRRPA
ncbi:pirin family protein [Oerskovia sp. Sa1BUA8]|uniref:Pirin family protein n=1 Tax=Oerskovia douganii TaxID=2762210 RepID=A0A9D5UBN3_9CELL|nr:pirin family protein [Oerskovia douganii]MBE7701555.1 pirin family protein [Oerskovia douganii]